MKIIAVIALTIFALVLALINTASPLFALFISITKHDKLIHCIGSQILFCACFWVYPSEKAAFCAVLGIGISIEICQHFTGRGFSWGDILADVAGVVIALISRKI